MGFRSRVGRLVASALLQVFLPRYRGFLYSFVEMMDAKLIKYVDVGDEGLKIFCPNRLTLWRVETFHTKEPDTLAWIDSFQPGNVLWDIGANIGLYSLYGAAVRNLQVVAFEPSFANFFLLCRNIEMNKLDSQVSPFCVGLSNETKRGSLNMTTTEMGGALSEFGGFTSQEELESTVHTQASLGFRIDDLIDRFDLSFPNHIKIDVDSIEHRIVEGAGDVLMDSRLKSILIELDEKIPDQIRDVTERMAKCGLELAWKRQCTLLDNSPYASVYNYLFTRN